MTTATIKPIETEFAGCRFRSRLEARWAVILTAAGHEWEYEPEGFETPYGRYLPDFRVVVLPGASAGERAWLEIKPPDYVGRRAPSTDEYVKDLGRWFSLVRQTRMMLVVACGLDGQTIIITPEHTYTHDGHCGFVTDVHVAEGKAARFEHGESG